MGGGLEGPQKSNGKGRELLLCVLPWPKNAGDKILKEIEREYPNLDVHYFEDSPNKDKSKNTTVPEDLQQRAKVMATLSWLPPNVQAAPNLELIQFFSAGTNHIAQHPIYTDSEIPLTTASGVHGPQIAEWVIMMNLIHSHHYPRYYELQKDRKWENYGAEGRDVRDMVGQRVGVLGYGSIGRQVARVAQAMGMDVIAFTASPRESPESKKDNGFIVPGTGDPEGSIPSAWYSGLDKDNLHKFLSQNIDLLAICVPLTEDTKHLLSTPEFELLSKSNPHKTYIANISRGAIIDQSALITALEKEQISGAALDVTDPEPLPKDNPLWTAPNVLITPHISGGTTRYAERAFQVLKENLGRRKRGEKFVNLVDRKRGY
ncbi:hypothetical protein GQ43DRAFT_451824 [Delitschia confertaspora ATCC 74209]|uniref:D-isomer specific 2-hydroxyacid dehydrogenase NAD-binding domain-containing protein n=1 Tax=Delitschia confertaspora ATCC 74209 TaxID=1513339 RepID=A0A9P4JD42_9PLEO|nr:hypothetical protein GQ43DRAFT_451824 [Delitschia confertaspora ATCC 74209]